MSVFGENQFFPSMTLHEYAAISLKVPESGTPWLDEMITTSIRDRLALNFFSGDDTQGDVAERSYEYADAMLKAREVVQ
jgi:hypothetical protein